MSGGPGGVATAPAPRAPAPRPRRVRVPCGTYRLQFSRELDFAAASRLVPYLLRLGVSDVYASPCLGAPPGSTHGYDISDHNQLNPALGGEPGYLELAAALQAAGMGLVLDFVPNHMGVDDARANRWWWDVLENGTSSPYARYFDIDWDPVKPELKNKVLLPLLGDQYGRVLERGELSLGFRDGALTLHYFERELPVNPRRAPAVLRRGLEGLTAELGEDDPDLREFLSILTELDNLPRTLETDPQRVMERQREKEVARERLARLVERSTRIREHIDACVRAVNGAPGEPASFDPLHALLEVQVYRLAYWRTAFHEINYRRFFDVNALASLRMEDPQVFEATHALLLRLIGQGDVTGVRLDHVDGLFDPRRYLDSLAQAAGTARGLAGDGAAGEPPLYVVVEKVLSTGESLPESWRAHGTTGYDFLNDVNGLFVDPRGQRDMLRHYERFTGRRVPFADVVYESKKVVMEATLASELNVLAHALNRISEGDRRSRDFTLNSLHDMLLEVVACFPVYRTYVASGEHTAADAEIIEAAVRRARRRNPAMDASIFEFFKDVMLDRSPSDISEGDRARRREFAMKFQQFTGPVQAKGVEDTAFYRYNVLLSLNEVGGAPQRFARLPAEFHAANRQRLEHWPFTMLCTSTHDTKRGEDVRARLDVLSEIAGDWSRAASRWARINAAHRTRVDDEEAPDRNDEYLFYQTLLGVWPARDADVEQLSRRLRYYMMKATHEAKVHTSWINENLPYGEAVERFVREILTGKRARRFLDDFLPFQRRVARLGMVNSLAQLVLKLIAPGVPDFYQGSELWDLSLVDPDNRSPVDFAARAALLEDLEPVLDGRAAAEERGARLAEMLEHWEDGRIKLYLTACGLRVRRGRPALFLEGDYLPLAVEGDRADQVVAIARPHAEGVALAVAPRLVARLRGDDPPLGREAWGADRVLLPPELASATFRDEFGGGELRPVERQETLGLPLAELLQICPVALLTSIR